LRRLTLTFDNGPHPEVTPRVLDVLRARNLKAHFFVLGKFLTDEATRSLVVRAHDEGHVVSNHSFTHEIPLGNDPRVDAVQLEIAATQTLLDPITNGARRFRPFGGGGVLGPHLLSRRAVDYLVAQQYSCLLWNSVPRDWIDPKGWVDVALADCARLDHTVLVLHDIANAALEGLERFLDDPSTQGHDVTTDFPESCLPIVDGKIRIDLDALVR
jgi:peptidoglycan/xylan/chitin deacetylase (PgdA/CDA1 family)